MAKAKRLTLSAKKSEPLGPTPVVYGDDTSETLLARAWSDYDLNRLTARDALERWAEGIRQGSDARQAEIDDAKELAAEAEKDKERVEWQLKVALEAVKRLRESIGETLCEVSACLGKIANPHRTPTADEVAEWDFKCGEVLRELEGVANSTCLRPGREDDFNEVADCFGIERID